MWFSETAVTDDHVYRRPLPSGGYVAIYTQPVQPLFAAARIRGHVVVERRSGERAIGHPVPIAAVAEHEDIAALLATLVPIAESDEILNATLARRVTIPVSRKVIFPR